jgi:hypothetical protein
MVSHAWHTKDMVHGLYARPAEGGYTFGEGLFDDCKLQQVGHKWQLQIGQLLVGECEEWPTFKGTYPFMSTPEAEVSWTLGMTFMPPPQKAMPLQPKKTRPHPSCSPAVDTRRAPNKMSKIIVKTELEEMGSWRNGGFNDDGAEVLCKQD